jgi:hypothetical protein
MIADLPPLPTRIHINNPVTVSTGIASGSMPKYAPKGCKVTHVTLTTWAKRNGIKITLWMCSENARLGQYEAVAT